MKESFAVVQASRSDIDEILDVEESAWGPEGAATREMFEKRISIFPEGVIVAKDPQKIVIGVVVVCIRHYDENMIFDGSIPAPNWYDATGNGLIESVHDLSGNVVYGVDLSVHQGWRGTGVGKALVRAGCERVGVPFNKKYGLIGSRMPGYHKKCKDMTPEKYVSARRGNVPIDEELAFFTSIEYCESQWEVARLVRDYFPPDEDSVGHGVLLYWKNPFFKKT